MVRYVIEQWHGLSVLARWAVFAVVAGLVLVGFVWLFVQSIPDNAISNQIGDTKSTRSVAVLTTDGRTIPCIIAAGNGGISCDWGAR